MNIRSVKHYTKVCFSVVTLLLASTVFVFAAGGDITGWVWSAYDTGGIGWASFSSQSSNHPSGGSAYTVTADTGGNLSGYAWNSAIGWVDFNIASNGGCSGSGSCKPKINGNEVTGWARACSVFQSGCSGTLRDNSQRGGWDGWISLNCSNTNSCGTSNYKVTINSTTGCWSGYAWGSPEVVGWINFNGANCGSFNNNLTVDLKANGSDGPITINSGDAITLSWAVTGQASSCTAFNGWDGSKSTSGGSENANPISTQTYSMACNGSGGTTASDSVTVNVNSGSSIPTISCTASPSSNVKAGTTKVTWTASADGGSGSLTYTWHLSSDAVTQSTTPKSITVIYTSATPSPKTTSVTVSDGTTSVDHACDNSVSMAKPPPSFKEVPPQ